MTDLNAETLAEWREDEQHDCEVTAEYGCRSCRILALLDALAAEKADHAETAAILRRAVAAREEAVRKFEQQVEFRREYERMAEKAEQERDDMERELRKSVRLEGERALASAAAKAQVAALSDEVRVQIVARDGQYDRALIAEAMLQIERDRYAALRDGVAGFVAAWRLAIKHEHAAAAPPLPTPDDLEAALLTRVDAPKPDDEKGQANG